MISLMMLRMFSGSHLEKLIGWHIERYRLNHIYICEIHDMKIRFYLPSLDTGIIENGPDGFVL